jgi:hypothetical protein
LRDEYTRTIAPTRALAAETLNLERTPSDIISHAHDLTPAEIELVWQTAPPRMPIPPIASSPSPQAQTILSLDGTWEVGESISANEMPAQFAHKAAERPARYRQHSPHRHSERACQRERKAY